uniref:J domain-containing protein n=1 Tax=Odontella aurita TaxID=265563 RepID=A0A7S4JN11_9STRA|mmetsp:Transcript_50055/g.150620  ORF Transcript_50055/g.150620 Transcript_50055/m.150620 type:complete len:688 (+) Transcript_50055:183-2246(+)
MARYDLAFFLCCFKSFLGPTDGPDGETFYSILGIDDDATPEEIKKAYKRRSLEMHPDKLAQRGKEVTPEDQARFTRMKEAYEILSDPHKRESYDALGEKGMKWLEEPFSIDPQQLAHNFAASSFLDRSKIFAIFVVIAVAIFILPVLICLQVDGHLGPNAQWMAIFTPLWIWDTFILFYHIRVIMMGPIQRPDHIPEDEWIDPLPMSKRYFSLFRFVLVVVFEILAGLKLDDDVPWKWAAVFAPIYLWEATTLYKKFPLARMRIVTVEDLEEALGKPFAEFTQAERELIARRYSVVPSPHSAEFEAAHKLKSRARQDCIKLLFRVVFLAFVIINLDYDFNWNWWAVFTPIWILSFCICCGTIQGFRETVSAAAEKDPDTFAGGKGQSLDGTMPVKPAGMGTDIENPGTSAAGYGAMADDGDGKAATSQPGGKDAQKPSVSDEEREELKAQVAQSGHRMLSGICSQAFLLIIVLLFVGKVEGAGYSSVVIISPFLFVAGIMLCCLGCTIFCVTEIDNSDAGGYEQMSGAGAGDAPGGIPVTQEHAGVDTEGGGAGSNTIYIPPPPVATEASGVATKKVDNILLQQQNLVETTALGVSAPSPAVATSSNVQTEGQHGNSEGPALSTHSPATPVDLLDDGPPLTTELSPPGTDSNTSDQSAAQASTTAATEEKQQQYAEAPMHSSLHELD